jgi:hypothetical protein
MSKLFNVTFTVSVEVPEDVFVTEELAARFCGAEDDLKDYATLNQEVYKVIQQHPEVLERLVLSTARMANIVRYTGDEDFDPDELVEQIKSNLSPKAKKLLKRAMKLYVFGDGLDLALFDTIAVVDENVNIELVTESGSHEGEQ